jgi:WD40 repeat protein
MSSLFVSNPCNFEGDTIVNFLSWSNSDSIAALASNTIDENDRETNQVLIMNNEGELIKDNVITHSAAVTAFEWQPNGKILAVGWADATLSCWICDGKSKPTSTFSNSHQHGESISIVKWNPMGKRLVSGDKVT